MKKAFLLLLVMTGNFIAAFAFRLEYGRNVTINQAIFEDLYITGGTIIINAPVYGDLVIAGGTIIINDTIANDLVVAGGNITFNGFVGDDIRCAGGSIEIQKNVYGDVLIAGGSIIIMKGASVGNLIISGGDITVNGDVNGEVRGAAGNLLLNGNIAKTANCRGGKITVNGRLAGPAVLAADKIVIGNTASFHNDIRYWNRKGALDFKQAIKNGKATYDPSLRIKSGRWYLLGASTLLGVLWYLGMALVMIYIIQYFFSSFMKKAADNAYTNTLKSLGVGFLFFIAVPLAAVVAFLTLVGVPVGMLLIIAYIILLLLATVITSVVGANWLNNRNAHNWNNSRLALAAFGIFTVLKLLTSIPFIGWAIVFLVICVAFGSLLREIQWTRRPKESLITVEH